MGVGKDLWNEAETLGNKHDWMGVASLTTTDAVYSSPVCRHEGREVIRAFLERGDKAFPDQTTLTSLMIEEGDSVVAEWTMRDTHTGLLAVPDGTEIPATGKTVEFLGVTVAAVRDREAREHAGILRPRCRDDPTRAD
jgi:predicted ester cyclase